MVTPGITICDRLRVLLPEDPANYYRFLDLVPTTDRDRLGQARIALTNFHAFQRRDRGDVSKTTKAILAQGEESPTLRLQIKWCGACVESWAASGTSSFSTARPTTATGAGPNITRPADAI